MYKVEHHIQDACEIYAVAELQRLAWLAGRGREAEYHESLSAFHEYLDERGLTVEKIRSGIYSAYIASVETHIPNFYDRLSELHPAGPLEFELVEVQARNAKKKADFVIRALPYAVEYEVSLKNYRKNAKRPQVCSGTFNSFILNMLFPSPSVGTFEAANGDTFRSSNVSARDAAVLEVAGEDTVDALHQIDTLNTEMRDLFFSSDFEYLDEVRFKTVAQRVGRIGRDICLEQVRSWPHQRVRDRVLAMAGLDSAEEALFFDPYVAVDSITSERFHHLLETVQDPNTGLVFEELGAQTIRFSFRDHADMEVLEIDVPFTINKNGAWISDKSYRRDGPQFHAKEGIVLEYGQRRPKKSREIATSINTYVEFGKAGIYE